MTKLDWEFQVKKENDCPFGMLKDEQNGPGHHLDDPDDVEKLENSFDGGRRGTMLGKELGKSPPYHVVSPSTASLLIKLDCAVPDANGSTERLKHPAEDLGE